MMATLKKLLPFVFLFLIIILVSSCNNGPKTPANDKKPITEEKLTPEVEKLVKHFKESTNFPIVMDSVQMSKVNKFDSLGSNEVKMLAKQWFFDSNLGLVFDVDR